MSRKLAIPIGLLLLVVGITVCWILTGPFDDSVSIPRAPDWRGDPTRRSAARSIRSRTPQPTSVEVQAPSPVAISDPR